MVVVIMGLLSFIFGGNADKGVDIPALIQEGALVVDVRVILGSQNIIYEKN